MSEFEGSVPALSVIRLRRREGFYVDSLRRYRVRIDGNPVGKIAQGDTRDFFVASGEHRVRLTLDRFFTSREVVLQIRVGEQAEFTCHPQFWPITALVLMWVLPHRWIRLDGPSVTFEPSAGPWR